MIMKTKYKKGTKAVKTIFGQIYSLNAYVRR